jgi:tripartite ATP-independent transporter DctM subunit
MLEGFAALPLVLFVLVFVLILAGFPVAFTLGGVSVLFGVAIFGIDFFYLLALRIFGIMTNFVLIAVPLFVFMGIMLQKSGIAERLLETMALLFGRVRGGLAISVVVVGGLLAASTGVVGATVITMGLISLPTMLKRGYSVELATGTIAASGTLGQIIPPSVVLVLLGSVLNVPVGDLFSAAFIPGFSLVIMYFLYILGYSLVFPKSAPAMPKEELAEFNRSNKFKIIFQAFFLPLALILTVLGSIFFGIASPTEASAVGALGATFLTILQGRFSWKVLKEVSISTTHISTMVFTILIGATAFSLIFRSTGGDEYIIQLIEQANLSPLAFLALVMLVMFVAGFFIDFIEIIFIIVPVVLPTLIAMKLDLIWVGILMAINLQTSFLTPPFGFALFYLKGVAPPEVKTQAIYRGVVPFILIQAILLLLIAFYPEIVTWLPSYLKE